MFTILPLKLNIQLTRFLSVVDSGNAGSLDAQHLNFTNNGYRQCALVYRSAADKIPHGECRDRLEAGDRSALSHAQTKLRP